MYRRFIRAIRTNLPHNRKLKNLVVKEIYGTIIVMTSLFSFYSRDSSLLILALKVLVTNVVFAFAEVYSEFIGTQLTKMKSLCKEEILELLRETLEVVMASLIPMICLLLSAVGIIPRALAFQLAVGISAFLLFCYGWICAEVCNYTAIGKLIFSLSSMAMGFLAAALKYLMH